MSFSKELLYVFWLNNKILVIFPNGLFTYYIRIWSSLHIYSSLSVSQYGSFPFSSRSILIRIGIFFFDNWNTKIKFHKIIHKRKRNIVFSRATFDRMGELLRTLLLLFLLIGDSADCRRTRRIKHDGQKACNTVRRCHNLQCCISTGIYPKYKSHKTASL